MRERGESDRERARERARERERYGQVKRRDDDYVGRRVLEMQLLGKRKWGKPKMRYLDVVKEDMQDVGLFHNHSDVGSFFKRRFKLTMSVHSNLHVVLSNVTSCVLIMSCKLKKPVKITKITFSIVECMNYCFSDTKGDAKK